MMASNTYWTVHVHYLMLMMRLMLGLFLIQTSDSFKYKPGYTLQNGVEITTKIVLTLEACFESCQARQGCLSIEIQLHFRLCRLSSSDVLTVGTTLVRNPGIWYSEKRDWAETTIDQRCLGLCSNTERCTTDSTVACEISECQQPHSLQNNSRIFGSQLSVGSNILHVCPDNIFKAGSVCGIDGLWSLQQLNCPIVCPDGWQKFQESCYLFDDTFRSFSAAENLCGGVQGKLVQVESSEENMFLKNYLSGLPMADYWIGMTDEEVEGQWKLYGTNDEVQFSDWYPNEGRYNSHENCAVFGDTIGYRWADVACGSARRIVCEIDRAT